MNKLTLTVMDLAQLIFRYERDHGVDSMTTAQQGELQKEIIKFVVDNSMSSLYSSLCIKFGWELNNSLLDEMK